MSVTGPGVSKLLERGEGKAKVKAFKTHLAHFILKFSPFPTPSKKKKTNFKMLVIINLAGVTTFWGATNNTAR